jgi:Leucine-rich repeat (LRR) protein
MVRYITLLLFIGLACGQDCTADDGTEGVELWGVFYSIEHTTELNLEGNQLTGTIPPEIENLTNLNWLELSSNQLTGSIPPELSNLTNLTRLSLGYNQLTGEIPPELDNL